ncbi:DNA/RNA polymerases superfamily protein [Gossypium australe]|uniref:DNA/RNA polymerases superfamily protein n=1 Tax=Gossypium australe TaxID=47621 RepID=A0A5B6UXM2_9ROSI|nr:DNA/RNA polymerases superfamily protein [Gossypium australe]
MNCVADSVREKLFAKYNKGEFWLKEIVFLRNIVSIEGVHVNPNKIEAIVEWISPRSVIEVAEGFATIVAPLTKFLQKKEEFA